MIKDRCINNLSDRCRGNAKVTRGNLAGLLALALATNCTPAAAQLRCGPRADLIELLAINYDEHQIGRGLENGGSILEIYTSDQGTWTMIRTYPNGVSCFVNDGAHWGTVKHAPRSNKQLGI